MVSRLKEVNQSDEQARKRSVLRQPRAQCSTEGPSDVTLQSRPRAQGAVAAGYESVAEQFETNFAERGEVGAAFAAYVDGVPVVDVWAGLADRKRATPWNKDTLVGIYSGSKGLVACCLLVLIERGLLALEEPVASYWPEFAANGKEAILVRDVVSHQARLPGLLTSVSVEDAADDRRMAELLAAQAPLPGPRAGPRYHALTFGWLCGELVRRVDGRSIGRLLQEEIADPLKLDLWIGLPEDEEARVATLEIGETFATTQSGLAVDRSEDEDAWSVWSNPPRFSGGYLAANLRAWRAAEIPASNGVATARSLARLYGALACGGALDGTRILMPRTIEQGRRRLSLGQDPHIGEVAFATGFQLQTAERALGPEPDAFGHSGAGGSVHGAWPSLRVGFSYTPNMLTGLGATDTRATGLLTALHAALVRQFPPSRR